MKKTQLLTLNFTFLLIISCSEDKQKETSQLNENIPNKVMTETVELLNKQFKKQQKEWAKSISGFNEYQYIIMPTIAKITNDGNGLNLIETLYSGKKLTKEMAQGLFEINQALMEGFEIIEKSIYFPNGYIDYRYKHECRADNIGLMRKHNFYKKITLKILDGTVINEITFSLESCTKYLNHLELKK